MSEQQLEEMGPIDYVVLEWADDTPVTGEALALLLELQDRGTIRILDLAFLAKNGDGSVSAARPRRLSRTTSRCWPSSTARASGLLAGDDFEDAASVLEPGAVAAVLVWENRWAAPLADDAPPQRRTARRHRAHPRPGHPRVARRERSDPQLTREHHARIASRRRPHRRRGGHRHGRQQPRLAPPGKPLGAAGVRGAAAVRAAAAGARPAGRGRTRSSSSRSSRPSRSRASSPTRSSRRRRRGSSRRARRRDGGSRPHPSKTERAARGKAARARGAALRARRAGSPPAGRRDPVAVLAEQDAHARPRAGADPPRADAGVAVHVLPRRGRADGGRPRGGAADGPARAALRRRAPLELRRVRGARPAADVRPQRLRRDAARPVRVGRQAARRELRGRRARSRVRRQAARRGSS